MTYFTPGYHLLNLGPQKRRHELQVQYKRVDPREKSSQKVQNDRFVRSCTFDPDLSIGTKCGCNVRRKTHNWSENQEVFGVR